MYYESPVLHRKKQYVLTIKQIWFYQNNMSNLRGNCIGKRPHQIYIVHCTLFLAHIYMLEFKSTLHVVLAVCAIECKSALDVVLAVCVFEF